MCPRRCGGPGGRGLRHRTQRSTGSTSAEACALISSSMPACQLSTLTPWSPAATQGVKPFPHIMVPLVGFEEELSHQVGLVGLGTAEQCGWLMGVGRMCGVDTWCTGVGLHCYAWRCKPAPKLTTAPSLNQLFAPQIRVIRKAAEDVFKAAGATVNYKVRCVAAQGRCTLALIARAALAGCSALPPAALRRCLFVLVGWPAHQSGQVASSHLTADVPWSTYLPAYQVGTMIEVPRGALRAGDMAKHAEFFSFGTNDLTQVNRLTYTLVCDAIGPWMVLPCWTAQLVVPSPSLLPLTLHSRELTRHPSQTC